VPRVNPPRTAPVAHAPARPSLAVRPQRPESPPGIALILAIAVLILAVLNLNIPYYAITPGPALDVFELIDIDGAETKKVDGQLLLTTVSLHPINIAEAIRGVFDEDYEVFSRSTFIPKGETEQDADLRSTEQMTESQQNAAAAALSFLKYPVKVTPLGVRVTELAETAPARDVLRRGDLIVGADTASVKKAEELVARIKAHKVGEDIVLKVKRGSQTLTVKTRTIARDGDINDPIIGVILETAPKIELPLAVDIDNPYDIGGPSAGLMFALGIVDLLDGSDLAKGRTVAGTGEIAPDGKVSPVGGVNQKVAGALHSEADIFLVPSIELGDACRRAHDMPVYAVDTLADAVRVLRDPAYAERRSCP
jgi:PDZ domain-containing protein